MGKYFYFPYWWKISILVVVAIFLVCFYAILFIATLGCFKFFDAMDASLAYFVDLLRLDH